MIVDTFSDCHAKIHANMKNAWLGERKSRVQLLMIVLTS